MAAICGIDWAADFHDVCIADAHVRPLVERRFAHDRGGVSRRLIELLLAQRVELGGDRTPGRAAGRTAAGGRDRACWRSTPTRSSRGARPLPRRGRQVRPLRRDGAVRARAHRRPPLPAARPDSDETLALRALVAHPRGPRRGAGSRSPTSCAPSSRPSGPARRGSSPTSTARSRSPSWRATRAPPTPADSAPSAWPASSPATATAAAAAPTSCSSGCAAPRPPPPANSSSDARRAAVARPGRCARPDRRTDHAN